MLSLWHNWEFSCESHSHKKDCASAMWHSWKSKNDSCGFNVA